MELVLKWAWSLQVHVVNAPPNIVNPLFWCSRAEAGGTLMEGSELADRQRCWVSCRESRISNII